MADDRRGTRPEPPPAVTDDQNPETPPHAEPSLAATDPPPARSCTSGNVVVEVDTKPRPHGSQLQELTRDSRIPLCGYGLSAGCLSGIQPAGRNEFRPAMMHADFPAGLVNHPVMSAAQHDEILNVGFAAVDPFTDMVQCH